ncbi:TetR family transcriptional regulator [Kineococcus gypseus]|uniref:TetR family transcriptional regulator n=1 Tax=Kineococcus gypseus TaxID=1637102 RepID=UPI003D7D9EF7
MTQPPLRVRRRERTREAIVGAALELFAERGFEAVTLAEIARAAEVGLRTLFRYFPDKQEILFDDEGALRSALGGALAARPLGEGPAVAVREALVALTPLWRAQREHGLRRQAVVDASAALRARERVKQAELEEVVAGALTSRGLAPERARLLARAAVGCAAEALVRWLADEDPERPGLEQRTRATLADLAALLGAASA